MRLAFAVLLWLSASVAQAAGIQQITLPSDDRAEPLRGAVWYPCAAPPATVRLGRIQVPGVKDCPVSGEGLPLVVLSHGARG